ncbi:hypothetical protein [Microbacterium sp. P05]|uniref:hypothetical protein n=1 Tax=Microbacterium sp. P05 TaxID=3366948 RepID=UPI003744C017
MTKLTRALLMTLPTAALMAGCTATTFPEATSEPAESTPSPTSSGSTLPEGDAARAWLDDVLPLGVREGSQGATGRGVERLTADGPSMLGITEGDGRWEITLTCQSIDGSTVSYFLESSAAVIDEPAVLECSRPGEQQTFTANILYDGRTEATMRLTAESDAIVAYDVRSHVGPVG